EPRREREPEPGRARGQQERRGAVHADPEERGVPERDHSRVADQDVGRHGEEPPDQDLGQEPPPEPGQRQRRRGEQRHDERERHRVSGRRPAIAPPSPAHFGVGTNRPVGRKRSVRIRATNDTITAWAGLTKMAAYASSRLMKIEARIDPARFPIPPTTTTMNARRVKSRPMVWVTPPSGPNRTPLAAAIAAP